ncbi:MULTISPECIES: electron transport complex subunit RsxA [Vibrio]|jgi:electron transport complex protein RnfA|uniref:Ion-translocating oxidoreductase complex subunit A n=3 Tax=Vibrio TaxID=662 RepID=A0A6G7CNR4_9VIBR|nr:MULTISPECIES: electron transport complex subunit RsxA [Vibrio]MCF7362260.1 electron transport complex subunit RsxA [Vibrio sp. A1-b2]MDW6019677.1 electron transport complex subunit RsxA [Vibrio plantisponsor]NNM38993.1 electron transport complex subunit RsxA [Vibrio plantisponsor]PNH91121.1 electron transport complex subunit RsxA [Vibrio diazotrophicus]PNH93820.1 electron transport complex subunit RsxA [Vibrio diazotrophicus]
MSEGLIILLSAAFVNNVVLAKFLGLCPFMGVSSKISSAVGMGVATTFVLTIATVSTWLLEFYILRPLGLEFMRIIAFILVIAAVVQFTELYVKKSFPALYQALGVYLPLITTNCAVFGVALLAVQDDLSFIDTLMFSVGSAAGFLIVITLFAGLRSQLVLSRVPAAFKGTPIAFITAGFLSMAFMGFSGMA